MSVLASKKESMADEPPKLADALSEAESILKAAEERATALLLRAEKAEQEARDIGYQEGYEEGLSVAVESAVRLLEDTGAIGDTLSQQAAELALAIAGQVVSCHVEVSPETVKDLAVKALQSSIVGSLATIVVNPKDRKALEQASKELSKAAGGARIGIEADDSLTPGGCLVKTEFGEVDANVETLVDTIARRMGLSK